MYNRKKSNALSRFIEYLQYTILHLLRNR